MTTKIKVSELPEFDAAEYLNGAEELAAFLTAVLEENNSALLAAALDDIARSRGMTQVAKDSGITREKSCTKPSGPAAHRASTP